MKPAVKFLAAGAFLVVLLAVIKLTYPTGSSGSWNASLESEELLQVHTSPIHAPKPTSSAVPLSHPSPSPFPSPSPCPVCPACPSPSVPSPSPPKAAEPAFVPTNEFDTYTPKRLDKNGNLRRLAYGFYVTNDQYACTALTAARSIVESGGRSDPEIIDFAAMVVRALVSDKFVDKLKNFGMKIIEVELIENQAKGPFHENWKHSMTKILIFNQTQYERIIYMDSDAVVVRDLDWMFDLPPYFTYFPRAYWLNQPFVNGQFYIIQPNNRLAKDLFDFFYRNEAENKVFYDMDVANEVLQSTASFLPGTLVLLNTELIRGGNQRIDSLRLTVNEAVELVHVWHFSEGPKGGYGKPWHVEGIDQVKTKPEYHPDFLEVFRKWYKYRDELCL
ncbi:nucleotide-diphospho-sugar transferase [Cladochytrium replicatum]|nr:nucleotide-diphospho-sugar transferase [Cladochytrium replicatum]